jgi:hypothetical protein
VPRVNSFLEIVQKESQSMGLWMLQRCPTNFHPLRSCFSEMENRTALTLLARPLRRWEFLAGKLLGVWALLAVLVAALVGVTFVILCESPDTAVSW